MVATVDCKGERARKLQAMNREELKEKYGKARIPGEWKKTGFANRMVCTFFGAGTLPQMPGTFGSLAAAIVAWPMALFDTHVLHVPGLFLFASAAVFFLSIPFVKKAMADTQTEDPGWIVIDEVCGVWMSVAFVPCPALEVHPWLFLVAFGLFRFFDILKPLGIHKAEKLPGAIGVMADDLLGGIYAGILLALCVKIFGLA